MSTKATIKYGRKPHDWHLYSDMFEGDSVFLRMDDVKFTWDGSALVVEIPKTLALEMGLINEEHIAELDRSYEFKNDPQCGLQEAAERLHEGLRVKHGDMYGSVAFGLHVLHVYLTLKSTEFHDEVFSEYLGHPVCWHFGIGPIVAGVSTDA